MTIKDQYLGDGVYASYDGMHIVLDLRGQDNTTKICLDEQVFTALMRFRTDLVQAMDEQNIEEAHKQAISRPERPDSLSGPREA